MTGVDKIEFLQELFGNYYYIKELGFVEKMVSAPKNDLTNWTQSLYYNYIMKTGKLLRAYEQR